MMPAKEWLDELFEYRPKEGLFWKLRPQTHFQFEVDWYIWNKRFAHKQAGSRNERKRNGTKRRDHSRVQCPTHFGGPLKTFSVHRIAFAMMGVEVPAGKIIDHWDEDPWNNKWDNLRVATHTENGQNHSGWRKRKNNLPKGVYIDERRKNPYYSMLKIGDKYKRGIYRATIQEALDDYTQTAQVVHGEFMSTGRKRNETLLAP